MLLCIRFPGVGSFRHSERFHSSERGKKKKIGTGWPQYLNGNQHLLLFRDAAISAKELKCIFVFYMNTYLILDTRY